MSEVYWWPRRNTVSLYPIDVAILIRIVDADWYYQSEQFLGSALGSFM